MINKLWFLLIFIGIIFSLISGNIDTMNNEILMSGKQTIDIIFRILPIMALWLGIMKVANESKLLDKLTNLLKPLLKKILPEIPNNHESLNFIASNVIANIFGLGSAATPFGLKAMKSLQKLNNKDSASKSMITFLILNTSGLTIIPTTVISMRVMHNSSNPTSIVFACIISTFISMIISLLIDKLFRRIK